VWAFLPMAAIALSNRWKEAFSKEKIPFLIIGLLFPVVLFTTRVDLSHGADGNYFIFPIICLLIFSAFMLNGIFCHRENFLGTTMLAFAVVSSAVIFVTTDWGPGTRAFDLVFNRLPYELETNRAKVIKAEKISDIYDYFKSVPANSRVVGFETPVSRNHPVGFWLPVRYEPIEIIFWSRPELISSSLNFKDFLINTKIDYILLARSNPLISNGTSVNGFPDAINQLKDEKLAIKTFDNGIYEVWKLITNIPSLHARIKMKKEGKIDISLTPRTGCENQSNLLAKIRWSFPKIEGVSIEVKSESAIMSSLWVEGGGDGEATTGQWVAIGTEFIFRNKSDKSELGKAIIYGCDVN
jgi:hypothetical protein